MWTKTGRRPDLGCCRPRSGTSTRLRTDLGDAGGAGEGRGWPLRTFADAAAAKRRRRRFGVVLSPTGRRVAPTRQQQEVSDTPSGRPAGTAFCRRRLKTSKPADTGVGLGVRVFPRSSHPLIRVEGERGQRRGPWRRPCRRRVAATCSARGDRAAGTGPRWTARRRMPRRPSASSSAVRDVRVPCRICPRTHGRATRGPRS